MSVKAKYKTKLSNIIKLDKFYEKYKGKEKTKK
jgi:hypothetical protein